MHWKQEGRTVTWVDFTDLAELKSVSEHTVDHYLPERYFGYTPYRKFYIVVWTNFGLPEVDSQKFLVITVISWISSYKPA